MITTTCHQNMHNDYDSHCASLQMDMLDFSLAGAGSGFTVGRVMGVHSTRVGAIIHVIDLPRPRVTPRIEIGGHCPGPHQQSMGNQSVRHVSNSD